MSVCVSVCLSAAVRPHYCTDLDVTWGHGRGCPLVVHYWADLQSGPGLHCYGNITRTLVTSLRPSCDMTTWCERPAGRGLRALLAADWQVMGGILKIARCIWEVGVAGSPVIGRRRGAFSTLQAAWTAGFLWWHSGNKKRTQNVSEYMLVLALCLVVILMNSLNCLHLVTTSCNLVNYLCC